MAEITSARHQERGLVERVAGMLCEEASYAKVYHRPLHDEPMPSINVLFEIMERLRAVLFPGYFGHSDITPENMRYHIGANLDAVNKLLTDQVRRGYCFFCQQERDGTCEDCDSRAKRLAGEFLLTLPRIRELLAEDAHAAYEGDPASRSPGETIFCYPSITALTHYRVAHELYRVGVDLIPRILTEMAHSKTGIDIHPGATIGRHFFIDHGTAQTVHRARPCRPSGTMVPPLRRAVDARGQKVSHKDENRQSWVKGIPPPSGWVRGTNVVILFPAPPWARPPSRSARALRSSAATSGLVERRFARLFFRKAPSTARKAFFFLRWRPGI